MKKLILFCFLAASAGYSRAASDTLHIKPGDLEMKYLETGSYDYVIYYRQTKQSPAQRLTLVKITVKADTYKDKPVFIATQVWERDTIVHQAYTVFSRSDLSTFLHNTWWKSLGYEMQFDFENKTVSFRPNGLKGDVPDSIKTSVTKDFLASTDAYNLNWHADLLVYQVLPYKEGRTFMINYLDPGFGKAEQVAYSVTGSDVLTDSYGRQIDCWVLNHSEPAGTETFWIAKKTHEVLKEEDKGAKTYRYKVKLGIALD